MKTFKCGNCGGEIFFVNDRCVRCGNWVGYSPDIKDMRSFSVPANEEATLVLDDREYRLCANWRQHQVCNWLVLVADNHAFCEACRLNEVIPDLSVEGNRGRWHKMELAKRRCFYTLQRLSLPLTSADGRGLRFRFLAESPNEPLVLTGHNGGLITLNISEADEDKREQRRIRLREPYRTLIGHFRHELGHHYWDRLIGNTSYLPMFRKLFGDETVDYGAALKTYYEQGPNPEVVKATVTAYAAAHPWEDWAETWAHYMHITDMMETAASYGVTLQTPKYRELMNPLPPRNKGAPASEEFDAMLRQWIPLTCAFNSINRGMGLQDLYPFVLTSAVCDKLRFIHEVVNKRNALEGA
ncbi:MAG TPA: putative zinc-binding metallopeptidase [Verrucomicrobiae bacterium]